MLVLYKILYCKYLIIIAIKVKNRSYLLNGALMKNILMKSVDDIILAANQLKSPIALSFMENAACMIADCFERGNQVLIAGNGGSLCDAAHFAEELTGFFRSHRRPLPAIALTEPGHISCVSNDLGFEWVFSRWVEAYGKEGDIFIALTTSGNSANLVRAVEAAKLKKLQTITFLGKGGGTLKGLADLEFLIEDFKTSDRIQEVHMAAMHVIIELVEHRLF
jgi:D-sedoheptulose 7-phosphate isomerase